MGGKVLELLSRCYHPSEIPVRNIALVPENEINPFPTCLIFQHPSSGRRANRFALPLFYYNLLCCFS